MTIRLLHKFNQPKVRCFLVNHWFYFISAVLLVLLSYWGLWRTYFTLDDYWLLGWIRFQDSFWGGLLVQTKLGYGIRPFMDAQLWLRTQVFGLNPAPYYLTALVQHILVMGLVYWLVLLLKFDRFVAWLSILLFGTSTAAYSVVHWITGSNYSMLCIPALLGLCLFILYRQHDRKFILLSSIICIVVSIFTNEAFISILLLFPIYDLFVTLPGISFDQKFRKSLVHVWYWIWLIPYFYLQMQFQVSGTSQYTGGLSLGLHVVKNYSYLTNMVLPYISNSSIPIFLDDIFFPGWYTWYNVFSWVLTASLLIVAIFLLWRGNRAQRFLVCWIFISFLPFALWSFESEYASANRYRYVPSIAFSILLAIVVRDWWVHPKIIRKNLHKVAPVFVVSLLLFNLTFHQLYIKQTIPIGNVKHQVVNVMQSLQPPIGTQLVIEVPTAYFQDLHAACDLLYYYPVSCIVLLHGESSQIDDSAVYRWIKIDGEEITQSNEKP